MIIGAYTRVSTEVQTKGESLTEQAQDAHTWAAASGHQLAVVFSDPGRSGALPAAQRPGLTSALEALNEGVIDGLVVRDLDRLARELTIQEAVLAKAWDRPGVRVFTFNGEVPRDDPDDPMRTAMRQMAGVMAQFNKATTVKLLRDARRHKAKRGEHANGPAPYGWKSTGGELVPVADEQATIDLMHALATPGVSQATVARELNKRDSKTREGRDWTQQSVSRVMHRIANRLPAQVAYQDEQLARYRPSFSALN